MKTKNWGKVYLIMLLVWIPFFGSAKKNNVTIYPMPRGEKISTEYAVSVAGRDVPVYIAKVAPLDKRKGRVWALLPKTDNSIQRKNGSSRRL